jgi:exodeoxyribonuclease V alpha subunit
MAEAKTGALFAGREGERLELEAVVERIRFRSPDGAFTVFVVRSDDGALWTARTRLPEPRLQERLRLEGTWARHRTGEMQLDVDRMSSLLPVGRDGMVAYLGSGAIRGIGEVWAARIVDHFGDDTFRVLDETPERLRELPGFGARRLEEVKAQWSQRRGERDAVAFLQGLGMSPGLAIRVFRELGGTAPRQISENPYRLVRAVRGIGFRTADRIAASLGIVGEDPRRATAAVYHVLVECELDGQTAMLEATACEQACALAGISAESARLAVAAALTAGDLVAREAPDDVGRVLQRVETDRAERALAAQVARRAGVRGAWGPRSAEEVDALARARGIALGAGQREALRALAGRSLAVLTGGPGTGKTTIVRLMVDSVRIAGGRVALAAPTGRASRRLQEATGTPARTLHRLLEFDPRQGGFSRGAAKPIEADVVIVDEASMLDLGLALSLFEALSPNTQLLLVGDEEQLPSVGAGNVLADLLSSRTVTRAELTEVFRQSAGSRIVEVAHEVREGRWPEITNAPSGDVFVIEASEADALTDRVLRTVAERIPLRFGLDATRDVQVLVPMHAGPAGSEALNRALQSRLRGIRPEPGVTRPCPGDRVIQTRNDYDLEVFNGDIGFVEEVNHEAATLRVRYDGRVVEYSGESVRDLELAYAISVHKSQGSEFEAVVLVLTTQHYRMLTRAVLYTAITRARRLLVMIGSARAFRLASSDVSGSRRRTMLGHWLEVAASGGQIPDGPSAAMG